MRLKSAAGEFEFLAGALVVAEACDAG
jgi:hypothetical protein